MPGRSQALDIGFDEFFAEVVEPILKKNGID
jgi:hypothetical protein